MTSERVVALLQKAYGGEIEAVLNFQANAIAVGGVRTEGINGRVQEDIQEDLHHAEQLGKRLRQLDARPPSSTDVTVRQDVLQATEDSTEVSAVLGSVLEAERDVIATYHELIEAAVAAEDPVTEDLAVTILTDEEAYRSTFRGNETEH